MPDKQAHQALGVVVDPVTMGAVLVAVVTGVSEALGGQLWEGVISLVRRPFRGKQAADAAPVAVGSGEAELVALQQSPGDRQKAVALAEVLLARAGADAGFGRALGDWWAQAEPVREKIGNVTNTVSGGVQHGPVLQGRDFTNLTFGATPAPPKDRGPDLVDSESAGQVRNTVSGGIQYGTVLQGGQFINPTFISGQAAAAPVALAQLPALVTGFTGRETELARVAALLDPTAAAEAVVMSAVAGLAGVGKTALAIHAGHAARAAGWFPAGVLFIDLHGYDQAPVQPGQALDTLLRALGVPGEHIPVGTEQRAGLYRSVLAQISEPVLIVADNASTEAQVRPLLPGPGPHRVIVTSRHTLAGLRARLLDITVLDQATAVELLNRALRAARPEDDRISSDPAAGRLVEACGGLPLALQITAALLVADPALSVKELTQELADEVNRLEALRYDDGGQVSSQSVAAAFELSYRQLDGEAARLFRLLSVDRGPDVSTAAAAALADTQPGRARAMLGRLMKAHLIEVGGGRAGRWRMHDLLHLFARQLSSGDVGEREQAIDRLLDYYMDGTSAADAHLRALAGAPVPTKFTSREDALAWLDDERPNLIAAVTTAVDTSRDQVAMRLPLMLSVYLEWRRWFDDRLTVLTVSRNYARRHKNQANEAAALTDLGLTLREMGRFEEAIGVLQDAGVIYRETGDRRVEALTLNNLGLALQDMGRFEEAISVLQDAKAAFRETGDRHDQGVVLTSFGAALRGVGRFEEAIGVHQDAAAIYRETGDRHREGVALNNLGLALRDMGRLEEAISAHQDAAAIYRETGDRYGEAVVLDNLGLALRDMGRLEEAISAHQDAAAIRQAAKLQSFAAKFKAELERLLAEAEEE